MLVPDFWVIPVPVRECAANTSWPGALISGFCRPSRVGPALEKHDSGAPACARRTSRRDRLAGRRRSSRWCASCRAAPRRRLAARRRARSTRGSAPSVHLLPCSRSVQRPAGSPASRKTPIMLSPLFGSSRRLATNSDDAAAGRSTPCALARRDGADAASVRARSARRQKRSRPAYQSSISFCVRIARRRSASARSTCRPRHRAGRVDAVGEGVRRRDARRRGWAAAAQQRVDALLDQAWSRRAGRRWCQGSR